MSKTFEAGWRYNEASGSWLRLDLRELWSYRELLYFLMWKDIKVRYKQTVLGVAWAVLQPVMTMVVFSIFFGKLAGIGSQTGGIPYPLYVYAALLPWSFFASAVSGSTNSLVGNTNLITKVYFPRILIPFASIYSSLVDLALSFAVFVVLMLVYGASLHWQIVLVPVLLLGTILAASGVGALFAALTVTYRDFRFVVPFMIQLWMFATPVIYPSSLIPAQWRPALAFNPMTGIIDGFRAAFLGTPFHPTSLGIALGVTLVLFWGGVSYFRSVERRFADVI